jgi:hypothetical protein
MQSRKWSLTESLFNNLVGYFIAVLVYKTLLPLFGYPVSWNQSNIIVFVFTIISIIRSYLIRRIFV